MFKDALNRIRRLAWVVQATYARGTLRWTESPGTLKIFVVPEFYFRPSFKVQKCCSYEADIAHRLVRELGRIFSGPEFNDWVFVCGTVIYHEIFYQSPTYHNVAIIVRGGVDGTPQLVEKQTASGIDGVPRAKTPGGTPAGKASLAKYDSVLQHFIDAKGLVLGVEICLEHAHHVLREVVASYTRTEPKQHPGVQLHILTAGGMGADLRGIAARTGGYLLRVDGVCSPPSELLKVVGWSSSGKGQPQGPADLSATPTTNNINPMKGAASHTPLNGALLVLPQPAGWWVSVPTQQVRVYPSQELPGEYR
jgi:hypothetical protein